MSDAEPTLVVLRLSAPLVRPDLRQDLREAAESEGWTVVGIEQPPEQREWEQPTLLGFIITLEVIGHVVDVAELADIAGRVVRRVAAAVRRNEKRRVDTVVRVIHGPRGEELARVDVPKPGDDGELRPR